MKIEAIAVDIDGTITDDTRKICISAIESLRAAEEKGIPTIIVTGNVVNYAYAAEVLIGCSGGLVAENGGVIFKEGYNNNAVEILVNREYIEKADEHLKRKLGEEYNKHASHDNNYRATEVVFYKTIKREIIEEALKDYEHVDELELYDSGFAIHVTDKRVNKGSRGRGAMVISPRVAPTFAKAVFIPTRTLGAPQTTSTRSVSPISTFSRCSFLDSG